jgi:hypothetical protein
VRNVAQKNLEATEPRNSKWFELCSADDQQLPVQPHNVIRKVLLEKQGEINSASDGKGGFMKCTLLSDKH